MPITYRRFRTLKWKQPTSQIRIGWHSTNPARGAVRWKIALNRRKGKSRPSRWMRGQLRAHVSEVVRQSVDETLNGLLEAEADRLGNARLHKRNAEWASIRPGSVRAPSRQRPDGCSSELQNCAISPLKPPLLSDMFFEKALRRNYWWKCT